MFAYYCLLQWRGYGDDHHAAFILSLTDEDGRRDDVHEQQLLRASVLPEKCFATIAIGRSVAHLKHEYDVTFLSI